jgi:16S rRNA (cytosine967-C5)-methyltransferase
MNHENPWGPPAQGERVTAPARQAAFDVLCSVELRNAFSDYAVNSERVNRLDAIDRNMVTEIVYGTLRWRHLLDRWLRDTSSRPWNTVDAEARVLLRMSLYQIWQMDRVPDHAAVNDAVELAKTKLRRGTEGFVNGILRNLARSRPWQEPGFERMYPPWERASLPRWLWERWERRWGKDAAFRYAQSLNRPPQAAFRFTGAAETASAARFSASDVVPGAYLAAKDDHVEAGEAIAWQDEASQLVPLLAGDVSGLWIWDVCAAPGGKSSILRGRTGPDGFVLSSEIHIRRARRLRSFLQRGTGGKSAVVVLDARKDPPVRGEFDLVMADVPCSGLGTVRRNPEIKWRVEEERLADLSVVQSEILSSAAGAVRPAGLLLYSTCSTEPEENEHVVEGFLRTNANFALVRPEYPPGAEAWLDERGFLRTFPSERRWDGFFAALMQRR